MLENKKVYLLNFLLLVLTFSLIPSVLAIQSYDQTVYKINSNYKEDCYYKVIYSNSPSYSQEHHYPNYKLHKKSSYENSYEMNNWKNKYNEKSYQKNKKGFLGTYVKEYTVEIKNLEKTGEYFIVNFNLKDKNGFERKESVKNYIKTGETEKFVYRDIQFEKNEILRWSYTIDQVY